MKEIDGFTQDCYDYLDQVHYYLNDATTLGPILEDKFGLECYIARQIVSDWIKYHTAQLSHPYDRQRFFEWWTKPQAA